MDKIMLTVLFFISATISAYYWNKYVFRNKISQKEMDRYLNESPLSKIDNPKRNKLNPPHFEYEANK